MPQVWTDDVGRRRGGARAAAGPVIAELADGIRNRVAQARCGADAEGVAVARSRSQAGAYIRRWATRLLKEINEGKPLARSYPYPVEVWRLGGKQLWIALGGEVVVDYDLRFKERYGADAWVTSYANDVMAYIPSLRVLREDMVRTGGTRGTRR